MVDFQKLRDIIGTGGAAGGLVEGDYTNWVHKWTNDIPGGLDEWPYIAGIIDEQRGLITLYWIPPSRKERFGIFRLEDFENICVRGVTKFYTADWCRCTNNVSMMSEWVYLINGGISTSLVSYVLLLRDDYYTIEVWRGGSEPLWSVDMRDYVTGGEVLTGMISRMGKYVIVSTTGDKLVLFEGE